MLNNSSTFSGKPIEPEEFLDRMVKDLGMNRKNGICCPYFLLEEVEKYLKGMIKYETYHCHLPISD